MSLFQQRLLAEGVRTVESDYPALSAPILNKAEASFELLLLDRAKQLDQALQISTLFTHFKALTNNLFALLSVLLLVLGAGSVGQLFSEQGTQINFFWAFGLFFIPNLLALCIWLFLFLQSNLLSAGWLAHFSLFLFKTAEKRFNPQATLHPYFWPLFKCYFKIILSGDLGRYQLSYVTHLLWLSYFFGATIMLVIMLATHQVDFIWETSILSAQSFQWLTEVLAYIPNLLGVTVPNTQLIQQSHLGAVNVLADAQNSRLVWSSLLISSLLIYGILPRFLLLLLMRFLLTKNKERFHLTLSGPYYVQLRQQLKPNVTSLGIKDPDLSQIEAAHPPHLQTPCHELPSCFYPVAVELSERQFIECQKHVKHSSPEQLALLKNVCDFQAQQHLLNEIKTIQQKAVVLYVTLARLPDRGLLTFIKSLTHLTSTSFYLLLIDEGLMVSSHISKRRSDWYQLAAQANIPLENIIQFQTGGLDE
ncbi:conserved hypothetical protein [Psychromonas ingrahamii 37]|uniref:DUF2868 domain-containing protein n=1 Tax=Psychromonas ingrahamii (strain DSM 17664 / CCUG 51855 / 37) TaxID=357804 RepID=A1T0B3_PSYIN|nr:DUF2868 domain-containing protein [Psychromonas ingrahamii]ABM05178.1 conserved hypothetical protein [Psychromonas ingrahamii 37]